MFDVAIIGCGPVDALAANLLRRKGLRVVVLEAERELHPLTRAVHLDHEVMRLFQWAGVIDRVAADMRDTDGHLHIGADHGVIRYMGTVGKPRPLWLGHRPRRSSGRACATGFVMSPISRGRWPRPSTRVPIRKSSKPTSPNAIRMYARLIGAAVGAGRYICELDPARAAARDDDLRAKATTGANETAADLIPAVACGIVRAGSTGAGERMIHPRLNDGRLLDDETGGGWRLYVRDDAIGATAAGVTRIFAANLADGCAMLGWLDAHHADALLVRPDHYAFGTCKGDATALLGQFSLPSGQNQT